MNTEKSDVHSITGLFVEKHSPRQAKYFGGFLALRLDEKSQESIIPFNGFLVDIYGSSKIYGMIGDKNLHFSKEYDLTGNYINYTFEKNKDGIWVGRYNTLEKSIGEGLAFAKTNLNWQGLSMRVPTPGSDGWAHDLIDDMINEGMLEIIHDKNTGQEFIKPI